MMPLLLLLVVTVVLFPQKSLHLGQDAFSFPLRLDAVNRKPLQTNFLSGHLHKGNLIITHNNGKKEKRVVISDFIVENAVGILFVTETWLKTHDDEAKRVHITPAGLVRNPASSPVELQTSKEKERKQNCRQQWTDFCPVDMIETTGVRWNGCQKQFRDVREKSGG